MPIRTFKHEEPKPRKPDHLICKNCGSQDSIRAYYHETTYGMAWVVNRDGELEDYDTTESDNFQLDEYMCRECEASSHNLEELILDEGEEFCPEDDDYEDMEEDEGTEDE